MIEIIGVSVLVILLIALLIDLFDDDKKGDEWDGVAIEMSKQVIRQHVTDPPIKALLTGGFYSTVRLVLFGANLI